MPDLVCLSSLARSIDRIARRRRLRIRRAGRAPRAVVDLWSESCMVVHIMKIRFSAV